jgi:hypothetical protein
MFVMIQMFSLIVLKQFNDNYINEDNPLSNFYERETYFKEVWVKYTKSENGIRLHEK